MNQTPIPPELQSMIGDEQVDFAVKSAKAEQPGAVRKLIFSGLFVTAFASFFVYATAGPLFKGESIQFESNGVPTTASPDNLGSLLVPGIIVGAFLLFGLYMIIHGIIKGRKEGGYFVGTPSRMISYLDGTSKSIDWEQFTGEITVKGTNENGSMLLVQRTGQMIKKNKRDRFVPDVIYIAGVQNVYDLERICRQRIKENDPTPTQTIN